MKFRLIINLAKHHFQWVQQQCAINGAQLWVLTELHERPGLRVNELAATMAMHQSTISLLVEKLVRAKLVAKERSSQDQRVVTMTLTRAGLNLLTRAPKPGRGVLADALRRLPPPALRSVESSLNKILKAIGQNDARLMKEHLGDLSDT